ncbi:histidine--tRNA ligase [Candidatus Cytomitobacter indipagum]|uniref:Histidine--tRNA ligase n=1 Tax=Candidatus Cytomitobacter indipagum TaxID=2601575 RepID=A0A5C0UDQ6_9PROT|nr:histidine--tRNA ligase [Candidatus Cytomitobacter indipagum]QEK37889.1 histidine--tRNA ligase [Candidatus Cytomitobacter indipagum]
MNVKGTIDWIDNYNLRKYVIDKFSKTMNSCGFDMIEPSILERCEFFVRTVGSSSEIMQKEMFFAVSKDKQDLDIVLRPEFTTSVVRSLIESGDIYDKRVSYFGKTFRHNRPQKGRYREFTQLGCEVFDDNPYTDIDVIYSAVKFLQEIGVSIKVKMNSLGSFETIASYNEVLKKYLTENNIFHDESNPMRALDKMTNADKQKYDIPKIRDCMSDDDIKRFDIVCSGLKKLNVNFELDDYLVRGLDYYNHTIFEIENNDLGMSILGGGAYSGLVKKMGGPDISGIGWSFGLERILMMDVKFEQDDSKIIVVSIDEHDYTLNIVNLLRNKYKTFALFNDFKKSLKKLGKLDPKYIVFCGTEERQNNVVKIKNCITGEQDKIAIDDMLNYIDQRMILKD